MNDWRDNLSKNLKSWRDAYGWSQDVLAEKAGCSKSVIRDLEVKKGSASLDMVGKIAVALNVSMETLLRSGQAHKDLSTPEINEVAEGASFNTLLDIVVKKVKAVPDDIIEMAYYFRPEEEVWDQVRETFNDAIKEKALAKKKSHQAG